MKEALYKVLGLTIVFLGIHELAGSLDERTATRTEVIYKVEILPPAQNTIPVHFDPELNVRLREMVVDPVEARYKRPQFHM